MNPVDKLYELYKRDVTKLIFLLLIIIIGIFLYPLYDLNFRYLNRIEQKASILKTLDEIKFADIDNNLALQEEYNKILKELSSYNSSIESTLKQYFKVNKDQKTQKEIFWKTFAGGIIWVPLILLFVSIGEFKFQKVIQVKEENKFIHQIRYRLKSITNTQKILIGLLLLGCIIGYLTPIFEVKSINYVLIPAFELLLFLIFNKVYQSAKAIKSHE